jgi:hypothetical protein
VGHRVRGGGPASDLPSEYDASFRPTQHDGLSQSQRPDQQEPDLLGLPQTKPRCIASREANVRAASIKAMTLAGDLVFNTRTREAAPDGALERRFRALPDRCQIRALAAKNFGVMTAEPKWGRRVSSGPSKCACPVTTRRHSDMPSDAA